MDTQTIDKFRLTGARLEDIEPAAAEAMAASIIFESLWVKFDKGYYVPKYEFLVGDPKKEIFPTNCWNNKWLGYTTTKMTYEQARYLYYTLKDKCPFVNSDTTVGNNSKAYITCQNGCVKLSDGEHRSWNDSDNAHLKIPTVKLPKEEFSELIFNGTWKLEDPEILAKFKPADGDKIIAGRIKELGVPRSEVEKFLAKTSYGGEKLDALIEDVLTADEHRAGIERYDRKCVEDVNLGHWELWDNGNGGVEVPLEKKLVARNPLTDIRKDGLVGIDFGTKSTIVSFQDGSDAIKLHRVGMGQLSKKVRASDYENPTVIEFIDIMSFMKDYGSDEGRPLTSLEDLTVSHKAYNSLKNSESSDDFYSFFYDIKQWCGDSSRYKQLNWWISKAASIFFHHTLKLRTTTLTRWRFMLITSVCISTICATGYSLTMLSLFRFPIKKQ